MDNMCNNVNTVEKVCSLQLSTLTMFVDIKLFYRVHGLLNPRKDMDI